LRRFATGAGLAASVLLAFASVAPATAQSSCEATDTATCEAPTTSIGRDPTSLVGSQAPPTSGKNLTTGKGTINLADLLGKPTAIVFWLHTCPHCLEALPKVNRLRSGVGPHAQIVTAAIDAGLSGHRKGYRTPAAATKTMRLRVPTILVPNHVASDSWQVAGTPTAFIIDSSGVIIKVIEGDDDSNLADEIRSALAATN
jgi:thiol-disulfide isomerase/thioredoxin